MDYKICLVNVEQSTVARALDENDKPAETLFSDSDDEYYGYAIYEFDGDSWTEYSWHDQDLEDAKEAFAKLVGGENGKH